MAGAEAADAAANLPQLIYSSRAPPLAVFTAAAITGVELQSTVDPKRTLSSQTAIQLASGYRLQTNMH